MTPIDTPGPVDADETIDVTLSAEPICIMVEYLTNDDPALNQGEWDVVYGDGRFSYRYRASSRSGTSWHIAPPGGVWPGKFRLHYEPIYTGIDGGGIAANFSPILTPDAWYVLDPFNRLTDLSGNSNGMTAVSAPSDVAGPWLGYVAAKAGKLKHTGNAAFRTAGAVSFIALINRDSVSADTWICGCEDSGASYATWYKWGISGDQLFYACDRGGPSPPQIFAAITPSGSISASGWVTVAGTRSASGLINKGYVGGSLVGSYTQGSVAIGGVNSYLFLLQDGFQPVNDVREMLIGVYLRTLTDDEVASAALAIAGVP